jgi:hypothetical protein
MNCPYCGKAIPRDRAQFLRDSSRPMVCVGCTGETPRMVLMEYGHKTAGYAVIVPRGSEQRALRCFRRSR